MNIPALLLTMPLAMCIACLVAAAHERVARREAEQASADALGALARERASSERIACIAHDVNNMLTAIGGFAECIAADATSPSDVANAKDIVLAQKRARLALLSIRDDSASRDARVDIRELVEQGRALWETLIAGRAELDVDVPEGIEASVSAEHLDRILLNLILNAAEAMEEPGTIAIVSRRSESLCTLEVTDDGCGIPEEALGSIFDSRYTTKAEKGNSGFGLRTVRMLVECACGSISCASQEGEGAHFLIIFPLAQ